MPDTFDFAGTRNAYLQDSRESRNRQRSLAMDHPVPTVSGKDIYLEIARLCSGNIVQHNWSRIMLHGVSESLAPESEAARFGLIVDWPETQRTNEVEDLSDFDAIVEFIETKGRESVIGIFRGLRDRPHFAEALRTFTKQFADEIHREYTLDEVPSRMSQCESFVRRAQRLDEQGRTDAALDLIYDSIDEMLRNGQFSNLDSLLVQLPTNTLSPDMLLGVLTATLPARSRLSNRKEFFHNVEASLKERGEYEDGLLTGLE
ncbi:MAG: hypothetical protein IID46_11845 [Planctomycetes bacterium]|nr:hypothetical protein [Planctomycetota bacterium]